MELSHRAAAAAIIFAACAANAAGAAGAQPGAPGHDDGTHHVAGAAAPSEGEVRKVDKEQGKVTLRHGPLENLDMPAMTMVFRAADRTLLDGLSEGDKVRFTAEKASGVFTVTAIQVVR